MADEQPRMVVVDLTNDMAINTDGAGGGIMDIFVEPWHTNGTDVAGGVLDAVARRRVALTATVVSRSRGLPVLLGEKLLLVDGRVQSGGIGWDLLQGRVLADAPRVIPGGSSQSRTYTFGVDDDPDVARAGQVAIFFDLAPPRPTLIVVGAGH